MITTLSKKLPTAAHSRTEKSIFEHLEDPKATSTLPSLQSVLSELETLTQKNNTRLEEVTRLVQVDQGMSLRVLRMANSVYYAPSQPIIDVQDAILYIGLNTFRGAVVSTRCIEKTCHIQQSTLDWKQFWMHGAGVGHLTVELASHLRHAELGQESFYLMGLLHDIGKVVLAHLMPAKFDEIYSRAAEEKAPPARIEIETLGIEHGHLGAWYLEKQGIPISLCEPVRFHHGDVFGDKPHSQHALLIHLADMIALHARLGGSGNTAPTGDPFASAEWTAYLKLCQSSDEDGAELKSELVERVVRIADLVHTLII